MTHECSEMYISHMHDKAPKAPRNDVHNSVDGDVDPDASVTQTGHLDHEEPSNAVHNHIRGNISGSASVIQAGNINGNIDLR